MEQCERCGTPLPTDASFCGRCGFVPHQSAHQITGIGSSLPLQAEPPASLPTVYQAEPPGSLPTVYQAEPPASLPTVYKTEPMLGEHAPAFMVDPEMPLEDRPTLVLPRVEAAFFAEKTEAEDEEEQRQRDLLFDDSISLLATAHEQAAPLLQGTPQVAQVPSLQGTPHVAQVPSLQGTPHMQIPGSPAGSAAPGGFAMHASPSAPGGSIGYANPPAPGNPAAHINPSAPGGSTGYASPPAPGNPAAHINPPAPGGSTGYANPPAPGNPAAHFSPSAPGGSTGYANPPAPGGPALPRAPQSGSGKEKGHPRHKGTSPHHSLRRAIWLVPTGILVLLPIFAWIFAWGIWVPGLSLAGNSVVSPGSSLSVEGQHFLPNSSVRLILDNGSPVHYLQRATPVLPTEQAAPALASAGQMLADLSQGENIVQVQGDGTFSVSFLIDPAWTPGQHTLHASETLSNRSASLNFTIAQASTSLTPTPTLGPGVTPGSTPTLTPTSQPNQRQLTATQTASQTVNATGKVTTSPATHATGTLTIATALRTTLTLAAGTVLSNNGSDCGSTNGYSSLEMVLNASVSLAPLASPTRVSAHVAQAGSSGNIPVDCPGGDGSPFRSCSPSCTRSNWYAFSSSAFTGGQNAVTAPVVQQSDITNAATPLISSTTSQAKANIQSQLHANEHLVGTTQCQSKTSSNHAAGDQASTVTVTVTTTCTASASTS